MHIDVILIIVGFAISVIAFIGSLLSMFKRITNENNDTSFSAMFKSHLLFMALMAIGGLVAAIGIVLLAVRLLS